MPSSDRYAGAVARNFLALGSGEALARIAAFAGTIYVARTLGASGYGIISFAAALMLYLSRLADDIRSLLDAGASRVRLEADGIVGDLVSVAHEMVGDPVSVAEQIAPTVVVVLRPGPHTEPEVRGDEATAGSVRIAIAALTAADGDRR